MKTMYLTLVVLMSSHMAVAQSTLPLRDLPVAQFLDAVTGDYQVLSGEPVGCPNVLHVSSPTNMGSNVIEFESVPREPGLWGFIQRIDGPTDTGGPHWDEIIEDRVRRQRTQIVSERRTCKDHFLFTTCSRWKSFGPSVSFNEDGTLMAVKPDISWFVPALDTHVSQCRYSRLR